MSGATTELGMAIAVDADDNADYLTIGLANALRSLDAQFNNVTGHNHGSSHQGGPITTIPAGAIPDGSITSAKIADGTITAVDIADRSIPGIKLTNPLADHLYLRDNDTVRWGDGATNISAASHHLFFDVYNANWYWRDASAGAATRMLLTPNSGGTLIVGNAAAVSQLGVSGAGTTSWAGYASGSSSAPGSLTTPGGVLTINDSSGGAGDGGVLLFSANNEWYAGIKGFFANGANNGTGDLSFATRRAVTDTFLTEAMRIFAAGNAAHYGAVDISGACKLASSGAGVSLSSATAPPAAGVLMGGLPGRVAGDTYLVIDAQGNVHRSAIGPAS